MSTFFGPYWTNTPFRFIQRLLFINNGKLFKSPPKAAQVAFFSPQKKNPFHGFIFCGEYGSLL